MDIGSDCHSWEPQPTFSSLGPVICSTWAMLNDLHTDFFTMFKQCESRSFLESPVFVVYCLIVILILISVLVLLVLVLVVVVVVVVVVTMIA